MNNTALKEYSSTEGRWFSVDDVAEHLGVKRDTIYKWIERKSLPAHKVGKLWKFDLTEVDLWVRKTDDREDA
jgi:excisionase family DNA binding protein